MSARFQRLVVAAVVAALAAAVVLLLGRHLDVRGVAAALIIGAGAGAASVLPRCSIAFQRQGQRR
jgi:hypothetical protein